MKHWILEENSSGSLNNIGNLYYTKCQVNKAMPYYYQALGIRERLFPDGNQDVASSLHNIGILYGETDILM